MPLNEFGRSLKKIRTDKDMSLRDLSSKCDISPSVLCRYENGTQWPSFEYAIRLADALNINIATMATWMRKNGEQ